MIMANNIKNVTLRQFGTGVSNINDIAKKVKEDLGPKVKGTSALRVRGTSALR